ncbi:MAG TPA: hypothetical protein ENH52_01875, partial [Nitrospirae bacterium]|nr:hypothetical protein [Nitrospirota bacterium]
MKTILLITIFYLLFTIHLFAAEVKNELVQQEGNRVVFEFDTQGEEKETEISIKLTINGKTYSQKELHIEGDY